MAKKKNRNRPKPHKRTREGTPARGASDHATDDTLDKSRTEASDTDTKDRTETDAEADANSADETSNSEAKHRASKDRDETSNIEAKHRGDKRRDEGNNSDVKNREDANAKNPKDANTANDAKARYDARSRRGQAKRDGRPARGPIEPPRRQRLPEARVTKGGDRHPVFWFGFEVPWAKVVVLRFAVFGILAVDALLQIRHASRYGATDFNVAQVPFLDDLGPGRIAYGAGQLAIAYLLVLAALGVGTRLAVPVAAALYSWLYFGSQLDSYQHHYLVALVLVIASFVPWGRTDGTPAKSWALRLLLMQLAIVYFWAAVSKLTPAWVDGRTLATQLTGGMRSLVESSIGFQVAAVGVIVVELALAGTIWMRRTWKIAAPLGILFHVGIIATGFEIGAFAYLMLALYTLVLPDRWFRWSVPALTRIGRITADNGGWIATGAAIVLACLIAWIVRFPHAFAAMIVLGVVPLALAVRALTRGGPPPLMLGVAHVVAVTLWLVVDHSTTVTFDYYKYWSGTHRRLANTMTGARTHHREMEDRAYTEFVDFAPEDPNARFHLGRIRLAQGDEREGLEHLHESQRLDPTHARAFVEEARYLAKNGKSQAALAAARNAVAAEPSNQDAIAVLESLQRAGSLPPTRPDVD